MRGLALALWLGVAALPTAARPAATSCELCHSSPAWFSEETRKALGESFANDVHAGVGLSCHDCHGGNPDAFLAEDAVGAMDPEHPGNPYRGVPKRRDVPSFCGRCHSDPVFMKHFRPDARVDQEREYATSHHGKALAAGDENVATCIDCHSAHGILRIEDVRSPVYPTHVVETCGRCHTDAERMSGYQLADGSPLPVNQVAGWRRSVHAAALARGDISAPTCNDCHGNHGAAPPGFDSVAFVCGKCHGREAGLFRASAKRQGMERHNELYLEGGKGVECAECHVPPEPQAALGDLRRFTECATCHGNHAVQRPTVAMLSPLPDTPCALCHEFPGGEEAVDGELARVRTNYERTRDALLREAEGREGLALYDWLVDRVLTVPAHHRYEAASEAGRPGLLPAFVRLYERFRIGKIDRGDGGASAAQVEPPLRCADCHAEEPLLAGEGHGYQTGRAMVDRMRELTVLTARADRTLLAARRGGIEVRQALTHLDQAVDAEIQLQALVHTFRADEESRFLEKQREGLEHARAALAEGHGAIAELEYRWRGLGVSLGVILVVLVVLAFRIRRLPPA